MATLLPFIFGSDKEGAGENMFAKWQLSCFSFLDQTGEIRGNMSAKWQLSCFLFLDQPEGIERNMSAKWQLSSFLFLDQTESEHVCQMATHLFFIF
jgi:hypothetical protein